MTTEIRSEDQAVYRADVATRDEGDEIIARAIHVLRNRLRQPGEALGTPDAVKSYLALKLGELEYEVFAVIWLDTRNQVIDYEQMFRGTINGSSVHPREVVKSALRHNAAACILAHNHPSGSTTPSAPDKRITRTLQDALTLVEVRVLDHIIVGGAEAFSFAEHGLL